MNVAEDLIYRLMGDTSHYTNSLKKAEADLKAFEKVAGGATFGFPKAALGNTTHQLATSISGSFSQGIKSGIQFSGTGVTAVVNSTLKGIINGFAAGLGNGLTSVITAPLGAIIGGISGFITGALKGLLDGAIHLFTNFVEFGLKTTISFTEKLIGHTLHLGVEYEKVATTFEVFTGSVAKGKKLLAELRDVAIVSPFTFKQLSGPAQLLLGMGESVENVIPIIARLGDIAGGDSERLQRLALAYGQVGAAGRFMGTELRQFTEAGVGIKDFADTMGVSTEKFRELMRVGLVGSDVIAKTVERITSSGGRFADMNTRINKTVAGSFNSLTEIVEMGLGKAGIKFFESSNLASRITALANDFRSVGSVIEQVGASSGAFFNNSIGLLKESLMYTKELVMLTGKGIFGGFADKDGDGSFAKTIVSAAMIMEKMFSLVILRADQLRITLQGVWTIWGNKEYFDAREAFIQANKSIERQEGKIQEMEKLGAHPDDIDEENKKLLDLLANRDKKLEELNKIRGKLGLTDLTKELERVKEAIKDIKAVDVREKVEEMFKGLMVKDDLAKGKNILEHLIGNPKNVLEYYKGELDKWMNSLKNEALRRPIIIPLKNQIDPELKAFIESIEGKGSKGGKERTAFEKFGEMARGLNDYVEKNLLANNIARFFGTNEQNKKIDADNLDLEGLRQSGFSELLKDRLDKSRNASRKDMFGSGALTGSQESVEIINRSAMAGEKTFNVQQEIKNILDEMKKESENQHRERIEIDKEIRDFLKANPGIGIKPKKI